MPLSPMRLTRVEQPPHGEGWIHQIQYDGFRCLLEYDGQKTTLWSLLGLDCTVQFPEIAALRFPQSVLLDGEMVIFEDERTDFEAVMQRLLLKSPLSVAELAQARPASYVAFDMLRVGEVDIASSPLYRRLKRLAQCVPENNRIVVCESFDFGGALFQSTLANGLEGVVSKLRHSRYVPGAQSDEWRTAKHYKRETMSVIGIRQREYELLVARENAAPSVVQLVPAHVRHEIRLRMNVSDLADSWVYLNPPIAVEVQYANVTRGGWLRDATAMRVLDPNHPDSLTERGH